MKYKKVKIRNGIVYIDVSLDKVRYRISTKLEATPANLEYAEVNWFKFINKQILPSKSEKQKSDKLEVFFKDFAPLSLRSGESLRRKLTNKEYFQTLENKILPFFGNLKLNEIKALRIKNWQSEMYKTLSPKRINNIRGVLNIILNDAVNEGLIDSNPLNLVKKIKLEKTKITPFSLEEVQKILQSCNGWFKNMLSVAFFTGIRTGELLALTWEDIDFENESININKAMRQGVLDKPKTQSSIREIDMLPIVKNALLEQYKLSGNFKHVFVNKYNEGFSYAESITKKYWYPLLLKIGLSKRTFYQTRHTFASIMISKGEDPVWVGCKMMGHANIAMTLSVYTKYIDTKTKRAGFLDNFVA